MATSQDYIIFVSDQIRDTGEIRYKKMFGEYMVYVNDKPILLVCNNTVYIKKLPEIQEHMTTAELGFPYNCAKEHYILDIEDSELSKIIIDILEPITKVPKPKKKPVKKIIE